jgi:hypothetical protein
MASGPPLLPGLLWLRTAAAARERLPLPLFGKAGENPGGTSRMQGRDKAGEHSRRCGGRRRGAPIGGDPFFLSFSTSFQRLDSTAAGYEQRRDSSDHREHRGSSATAARGCDLNPGRRCARERARHRPSQVRPWVSSTPAASWTSPAFPVTSICGGGEYRRQRDDRVGRRGIFDMFARWAHTSEAVDSGSWTEWHKGQNGSSQWHRGANKLSSGTQVTTNSFSGIQVKLSFF